MYAKVTSLGVTGLAGYIVQVEADLSGGLPQFNLVGLPDSAVKESSERVRSAIKNLHYEWPASRITINLAPADVRKTGPVYHLPVFVGILAAQGNGDSAVTVFGMLVGAALAHNFGLAGNPDSKSEAGELIVGGISTAGKIAVVLGLVVMLVVVILNLPKKEEAKA